jgi:UDP-sugar transporter A1/2/3
MTEVVSSKEILLVSEILKVTAATYLALTDTKQTSAQGKGIDKLIWLVLNSGKMFVLAAIYGAMNILSFVALEYIGAGEFTICAQV